MGVVYNIKPLLNMRASVKRQLDSTAGGPLAKASRQCAVVYRAFVQRRFVKESRGGDEWPALAESTIKKRRKGKGSKGKAGKKGKGKDVGFDQGSVAILRDTGQLFQALDSGSAPGAIEKPIPGGIRVGYGGSSGHKGGPASIADIAGYHDAGGDHLPRRKIIVEPDAKTEAKFKQLYERAMSGEVTKAGKV